MKVHVSKIMGSYYYHLRRLFHLRNLDGQKLMVQLITSLILSDLTIVILFSLIFRLQPQQLFSMYRTLLRISFVVLMVTALLQLHCANSTDFLFITEYCLKWLLMYDVFHHRCPAYLHNLITFTESHSARSRLRSSSTTRSAVTVRTRTKLGSRAFYGPIYIQLYSP